MKINVVAIFYHSEAKYALVQPGSDELPFDDENKWDEDFRNIWISAKLKW